MIGTKLSSFDKDIIDEIQHLPESVQRKVLLVMIEKRRVEGDLAAFSDMFTSKLTSYKRWFFKKWTGLDVTPTMFTAAHIHTLEGEVNDLIIALRYLNIEKDHDGSLNNVTEETRL
jgi:hypothetical protein